MANKMPENGQDRTEGTLPSTIEKLAGEITLSTKPVLICGVNRKVATGGFENIDIYAALSIPLDMEGDVDLESLVSAAADQGFGLVSGETLQRYQFIKEMQKGGRK